MTTNPSPLLPFELGLASLERGIENIDGASEGSKLIGFRSDIHASEQFQRRLGVGALGYRAVDFGGQSKSKGPQIVGGKWIAMASIHKHGASAIGKGLNSPLSDPVLVVGIDAAEGQGLIGAIHRSAELLGRKNAVVAMIVFDNNDVVSRGESFEGLFCLKGVFGGGGFLRIYKVKARCMVNKNGSNRVAALHQLASTLCYQTGSLRDELVDGNYVARLCGRSANLSSMAASAPRAVLGFAEEATHTFGHVAIRDALR
jgi:hypothetical protein